MDGATSGKSFGSGYSLDDFWKLCGLVIAGKDTSNLYNYYKASYMTDFAVLESAGEHNVAFESISNDAMHREIFLGDMRLFKQFVLKGSNGDKALDILALGEKAYQLLGAVKYELGELFPSGKVWQVRHYANGGAIHLMQNLLWIYNERNRGSAICLPVFPPIRPGKSMVLSS